VIKSFRFIFWSAIILISNLIFSCQNEDCVSTFNNELLVGFYESDTLENGSVEMSEKDTVFYAIVADGNDSIFYSVDDVNSVFKVPVNPAADMTSFEFYMIDSIGYDTLSLDPLEVEVTFFPDPVPHILEVDYRRFTRVISEDCGVEIGYVGLDVRESTFSSYSIESDRLTRFNESNDKVNVKIYF
jgi:hypothetical protein